jgi:hypothetical protein
VCTAAAAAAAAAAAVAAALVAVEGVLVAMAGGCRRWQWQGMHGLQ